MGCQSVSTAGSTRDAHSESLEVGHAGPLFRHDEIRPGLQTLLGRLDFELADDKLAALGGDAVPHHRVLLHHALALFLRVLAIPADLLAILDAHRVVHRPHDLERVQVGVELGVRVGRAPLGPDLDVLGLEELLLRLGLPRLLGRFLGRQLELFLDADLLLGRLVRLRHRLVVARARRMLAGRARDGGRACGGLSHWRRVLLLLVVVLVGSRALGLGLWLRTSKVEERVVVIVDGPESSLESLLGRR